MGFHLWVIRHGKAEQGDYNARDHDRKLAPRGHRDGAAMQAWFAKHEYAPEWIWTSTAKRARQTAQYVADGSEATLVEAPELYLATPEAIVDVLRATPPAITAGALVAHNPGLTHLVNLLADEMITDNLVTFGCALFAFDLEWSELTTEATGTLHSLITPKTLPSSPVIDP